MRIANAADLGQIDTFRFEDERLPDAALVAVGEARWDAAATWAEHRLDGRSFWLGHDVVRRSAWELVGLLARLGQTIVRAGPRLGAMGGLEEAVGRYVDAGAAVDQAHRHVEQHPPTWLDPGLPACEALRARLDQVRLAWRVWADAWARDFNAACRTHGFLPVPSLQQRALFDEVVRPMAVDGGVTVLFTIDALRYEMGEELARAFADEAATTVQLRPRLAELPTIAAVGMNALAPVATQGRMRPALARKAFVGFATGEFRVFDPESRRRAMQTRAGGDTCPLLTLDEVLTRDARSLRSAVARARLVIVHHRDIDEAGEKSLGPSVFDTAIRRIRTAWRLLRDAGVKRFVFAADHGFLMMDGSAEHVQPHGRKVDPKPRYSFTNVAADHADEVRVALSDLAYDGADGYLVFPESTKVFATTQPTRGYVHGGNSLQESVIPVLTVVHRGPAGGSARRFGMTAMARDEVDGVHCLDVVLSELGHGLDFGEQDDVELALRVRDAAGVRVELRQVRGHARLTGESVRATVGKHFDVLFRLHGSTDARVQVKLYHLSKLEDVVPCAPSARFAVTATRVASSDPQPTALPEPLAWLEQFEDAGVRQLLAHLHRHGVVTESEAANMLGGARALRRFAVRFEELSRQLPFVARIDVVAGVKRYVREGSST